MRTALILGANGALGRETVKVFLANKWSVFTVDTSPPRQEEGIEGSSTIKMDFTLEQFQAQVLKDIGKREFHSVINVAGGWAGGAVREQSIAQTTEMMMRQSLHTSVVASHVAATHGAKGALLVLAGAAAALKPTPGMVGYGMAKAAVHHLIRSIAADPSELPEGGTVLGVLPIMLDTPQNRAAMPTADYSMWTPTETAAEQMFRWSIGEKRPSSGSLVVWETKGGRTTATVVQ